MESPTEKAGSLRQRRQRVRLRGRELSTVAVAMAMSRIGKAAAQIFLHYWGRTVAIATVVVAMRSSLEEQLARFAASSSRVSGGPRRLPLEARVSHHTRRSKWIQPANAARTPAPSLCVELVECNATAGGGGEVPLAASAFFKRAPSPFVFACIYGTQHRHGRRGCVGSIWLDNTMVTLDLGLDVRRYRYQNLR